MKIISYKSNELSNKDYYFAVSSGKRSNYYTRIGIERNSGQFDFNEEFFLKVDQTVVYYELLNLIKLQ